MEFEGATGRSGGWDDASRARPRCSKQAWLKDSTPENLVGRTAFGFGFPEVRFQIGCHLVGHRLRDVKPFPLLAVTGPRSSVHSVWPCLLDSPCESQAAAVWLLILSNSIGVSIPSALWRRVRL
jgi:hypothetical protein